VIDCKTAAVTVTLVEYGCPCHVASIFTGLDDVVTATPVTKPVIDATVACAGSSDDHAMLWVRSTVVPSE
jgi:hypothetical protein